MNAPRARPRPAALIFDLDGTLVDSFADIATALNLTRERYGFPPLPREEVRRHVGSGSAHLVRALVPVAGEAAFREAFAHYLHGYDVHALDETRLFPGAAEVLERFAERRLAVVTNKTHHLAHRILTGLGVWDYFRLVLGGDSLPANKPDPAPVRHVLDRLALRPAEAVLVGDGLHDVHAGRAADVCTVAVTTGVESRVRLEAARPHHVIDRLDALLALFD